MNIPSDDSLFPLTGPGRPPIYFVSTEDDAHLIATKCYGGRSFMFRKFLLLAVPSPRNLLGAERSAFARLRSNGNGLLIHAELLQSACQAVLSLNLYHLHSSSGQGNQPHNPRRERQGILQRMLLLASRRHGLVGLHKPKERVNLVHFESVARVLPNGLLNQTGIIAVAVFHWRNLNIVARLRSAREGHLPAVEVERVFDRVQKMAAPQELPDYLLAVLHATMIWAYVRAQRRVAEGVQS